MLVERMPQLEVAVSATTRARREGEVDGREYWFLTEEEFEQRVQAGAFLEWVVYVSGHRYGTLASEIDRIAAEGRVCVLELETEGALAVKRTVPGAVTIFITASLAELERRLQMRATESAGEIDERLDLARHQLEQANEFDHVSAKRARQINNYHHQLGEGTFDELPPLVESRSKNYLTMALEEICEGKIKYEYRS
jgi:guanylate kinase